MRSLRRVLCIPLFVVGVVAGVGGVASVLAGPQQADVRPVTLTMFENSAVFEADPSLDVDARLYDRDGQLKATAENHHNTWHGRKGLTFSAIVDDQEVRIVPGDRIELQLSDGTSFEVRVPRVTADIDMKAHAVVGAAPRGHEVEVFAGLVDDDQTRIGTATADDDGRFALALEPADRFAVGEPGHLRYVSPEGHTFFALFAPFTARVVVGQARAGGHASLGTTVELAWRTDDGVTGGQTAATDPDWRADDYRVASGDPGWSARTPGVRPGATITVTKRDRYLARAAVRSATVPDLRVFIDPQSEAVRGHGPPNTELRLEVASRDEVRRTPWVQADVFSTTVTTDDAGRFSLPLAGVAALERGLKAVVSLDLGGGLVMLATDVRYGARVNLYSPMLSGYIAPAAPYTATLTAPDGHVRARGVGRTSETGGFLVQLLAAGSTHAPAFVPIEPGDRIEVQVRTPDNLRVVEVPASLSARTNVARDIVTGRAPAGWSVTVTSGGPGRAKARVATTADANGSYVADFSGSDDLVPATAGELVASGRDTEEFVLQWAAPKLFVENSLPDLAYENVVPDRTAQTRLSGIGTPGRAYRITYMTPGGDVIGRVDGRLPWQGEQWDIGPLEDSAGQPVVLRPGDIIVAEVGDSTATYVIPVLDGVIHAAEDLVTGRAEPGLQFGLHARSPWPGDSSRHAGVSVTADADGRFSRSLAGDYDLKPNDWVDLILDPPAGHDYFRTVFGPGLTLDLDAGAVSGTVAPSSTVSVTLYRAGDDVRAAAQAWSDERGYFSTGVHAEDGTRVMPRTGDEITVRAASAAMPLELRMPVPELTVEVDREAAVVQGRTTPGGSVGLWANTPFGLQSDFGKATPVIAADGSYQTPLGAIVDGGGDPIELWPGYVIEARYILPGGHRVKRRTATAFMNVANGGSRVCGYGPPEADVVLELSDAAGRAIGRASGAVGPDGRYVLLLRDEAGKPVLTSAGQTVRGQIASEVVEAELQEVAIDIDWDRASEVSELLRETHVVAYGPSRQLHQSVIPIEDAPDCYARVTAVGGGGGETGDSGRVRITRSEVARGQGVEVAFFTDARQRYYRQELRTLGQVHVHTNRITGRATPHSEIGIALRDSEGRLRATTAAKADEGGLFSVALRTPDGQLVRAGVEDTVTFTDTYETSTVTVEPLGVDVDPEGELLVVGPANAAVELRPTLEDGRTLSIHAELGGDGRVEYSAADVPPRADWRWADVLRVQVALPTESGHEIVAAGVLRERRPEGGARMYLPWAGRE